MSERAMSERTIKLKRLKYQSNYRGVKEMDIFLGCFAEKFLPGFSDSELDFYEKFLNESDQDIYDWIVGKAPLPAFHDNKVTRLLVNFRLS